MTVDHSSGADPRPDSDFPRLDPSHSPDRPRDPARAGSALSAGTRVDASEAFEPLAAGDPDGFGAGVAGSTNDDTELAPDLDAGDPTRKKRRRGSRGGRRRGGRSRSTQEGEAAHEVEHSSDVASAPLVVDEPVVEDSAADLEPSATGSENGTAPADPARRRRRGGRSRRGRRRSGDEPRTQDSPAPQAGGSEAALDGDDDFVPAAPRSKAPQRPTASDRPAAVTRRGRPEPLPGEDETWESGVVLDDVGADRTGAQGVRSGAPGARRAATDEASHDGARKRRRRGSRGGRRRKVLENATPVEVEAIPGEEDDLPELPDLPEEAEILGAPEQARVQVDEPKRGARGKKRGRKARVQAEPERGRGRGRGRGRDRERERVLEPDEEEVVVDDDEATSEPQTDRKTLILVNACDQEEQRVAVVEDDLITDFQMTVRSQNSVVNDIYRGRVVNLEPAIGAAFVDFGQGRNGFLHTSDVLSAYGDKDWSLDKLLTTTIDPDEWDAESGPAPATSDHADEDGHEEEGGARKKARSAKREPPQRFRARPRLPITDLLKKGEMVVVQVTKDAIGDKGPTLTTYISIPGRYLVLMPSMSRTGVSRKIEDEKERKRLKRILTSLEVPPNMGVIVRTAGVGRSKADLKRDLDYLKGAWEAFGRRLRAGHGPAPLYQESDVSIRTVRDLFTPGTEAVVVDDPEVHRQIVEFTKQLMPENEDRVKLYSGPKPLFNAYGVEQDFEKIFSRRIELPSGGSIVFDQAEALVAIDVNSGRTRTDGFDFEEIALKTNLEAAPEIARQIRLRDLGGIIVVDFIDMMRQSNMRLVERKFKEALESDRARSKIGRISQFGLLELTRQRLGPGMNKKVFTGCPRCRGTGRIRTVESRAAAIIRRLGSAMTLKGFSTVEVRAHPEVCGYLKNSCSEVMRALEYRFEREIKLLDAPEQTEDSVLRYLRTDGREVRPGGRRKR